MGETYTIYYIIYVSKNVQRTFFWVTIKVNLGSQMTRTRIPYREGFFVFIRKVHFKFTLTRIDLFVKSNHFFFINFLTFLHSPLGVQRWIYKNVYVSACCAGKVSFNVVYFRKYFTILPSICKYRCNKIC